MARLTRATPGREAGREIVLRDDAAYLVTGGLSGLGLLVARFLPTARHFFEAGQPGERGAYELLTASMGLGSIGPLAWSMYLWSQFPEHQGTFVEALVLGILRRGGVIG